MRACGALVIAFAVSSAAAKPAKADPDRATLRIALASTPNTLSTLSFTQSIEGFIGTLVFDGLVSATPDGTTRPLLAAVVPSPENGGISRDGRTIVYRLRRGVRWHDGAPFTSRDVAFTQRAVVDPNNNVPWREPHTLVARIDTPDDYTVVVHLKRPYAPFVVEWFPSGIIALLPEHLLGKFHDLNRVEFNAAPVGTGPFIFDHWDRGREIVFRANDSYFLGKPKVRRIVVQLMADENSRKLALRTGETDWSLYAAAGSARELARTSDIITKAFAFNSFSALVLQTRRPPLDDRRVRRAVAFALDRQSLVAKISGGFASPASADLGPDVWAYDATVRPLPFDPARSRELLAQAGWKAGANGTLERDGKPLSLLLVYSVDAMGGDAAALQIQAMLRSVGINVELKSQPPNIFYAPATANGTAQSGAFDSSLEESINTADPNDRIDFACTSLPPNGFNVSRWCNAEYDQITNHALLHVDRMTRKRDYKRASQILVDEAPAVFLSWFKDIELLRRGVHIDDGADHLALPYLWSKDG